MSQAKRKRRQASKISPLRASTKSTSSTMLWVIALVVVGGMYLAVSASVARAGREVLALESRRRDLRRTTSELQAQLAEVRSPRLMLEQAKAMGFRPARANELEYMVIPGYLPTDPFIAPSPPAPTGAGEAMLSPAYTETMGQWIMEFINGTGGSR